MDQGADHILLMMCRVLASGIPSDVAFGGGDAVASVPLIPIRGQ